MKLLVVTNMYPNPEQPAFGTFVEDQVEALRRAGVEVAVLFINGRKSKLNYLWGIPRLWWQLLKSPYEVIHAHYSLTGLVARMQFASPLIVTYHGGEVRDNVPPWVAYLSRRGSWLFDRIIVMNCIEEEILDDKARVRLIPCGVDLDLFRPIPAGEARNQLALPADTPLVLWAGEYSPQQSHLRRRQKRFGLVEESMRLLKQRLGEAELVVVSGKPHSAVPTYMSACDVLVLTSRLEGSPMVVKEALACNLPVVSTDVGDVADLIQGVDGCHLAQPEPQDLADKLLQVLTLRQRTNGRGRMVHLSSDAIARRIIAVYEELCPAAGEQNA